LPTERRSCSPGSGRAGPAGPVRAGKGLHHAKDSRTRPTAREGWLIHEVRRRFHEELRALEGDVQRTGTQAQLLLEWALQALARGDPAVCDEVIRGDDEVDQLYLDVERRILHLFALQTPGRVRPAGTDGLLHSHLHLERIADQAVNMAKITKLADGLPPNPTVLQHLEEMGALALGMVGVMMDALVRRDLELARKLTELDDPLDW
jgi:phosphate transport system protein